MGDLYGAYAPTYECLLYLCKGRHILRQRLGDTWTDLPNLFTKSHRLHPNEKHVKWLIRPIVQSSDVGDLVLDPFAGSGSVAKACYLTSRNSISIEMDKRWKRILFDRIESFGKE